MKKWANELNIIFSKEEEQTAKKHIKNFSISIAIKNVNENHIKIPPHSS
jgi:hypothetical protein